MKPTGKIWALVAVAVAALGALWLWFRRYGSKSPLDGATIKGAVVEISNVEAIQEIQVYEFVSPYMVANYDNPLATTKNGWDAYIQISYFPGDWYDALPAEPTYHSGGVGPWTSNWKARTVTVGEAAAHPTLTPPPAARNRIPTQ
ncbi:MAG: hypothetical protein DVB31_05460 [Verrucomicrobia bacterium]|nr:MAG: hypothetical protein DVB31_05460 [Verrucomicrobiota bacterium]